MQQNKECLTNGEGSVISTYFNQILIKHERSEDINSITEQHSYGNKDHSKDDEKVKVEILVPKLKHENEEVEKIKCIEYEYFAKTKKSLHNHIKIEHKGFTLGEFTIVSQPIRLLVRLPFFLEVVFHFFYLLLRSSSIFSHFFLRSSSI